MSNRTVFFELEGKIQLIGKLEHIQRDFKKDIYKKVLTIETSDGQVLFPELKNAKIKQLDAQSINQGDNVKIEYSFQGSEKQGKRYNNIYINSIKKL